MAPSGTVTTYFDGDVSGLKKATRDASKEMQNVAKAADRANTDAARGSAKAFAGISRMIATGKVSAKSLDKIGKSASSAISAASGFAGGIGAALGLGAIAPLSDLAVKGISSIRESLTPLAERISAVAHALDTLNQAQLDLIDSQLGIVGANDDLKGSLAEVDTVSKEVLQTSADLDKAVKGRIVDTAKVTKLTEQHHNALRAVTAAEITRTGAERHLNDAIQKHGQGSSQAADASDRLAKAALRVKGAKEKEQSVLNELNKERKGHKATEEEVVKLTDKHTAALSKAIPTALAAAHAQEGVIKADLAQKAAKAAVIKSTDDFNSKLKSLTQTADASNLTLHHTSGRFADLAVNTKAAAADVSKGLRDWAKNQDGLSQATKDGAIAAADLIDKTHKIPKDITTTFAAPGLKQAKSLTDVYDRSLGKILPHVSTKVSAPGLNRALGDAKGLYGELSRLDGKVVTTRIDNWTVTHTSREGVGPHGATGLQLAGRFDGRDNIPIWASAGEVLLNPRQQSMVDSGMTIDGALSATGAPTIRAGGGFAKGGKPKKLTAAQRKQAAEDRRQRILDRHQRVLDTAKDRFGARMSIDDLALAKAERTTTFKDDAAALGAERTHIIARIQEIRLQRRSKWLTRQQKQDLNDEEASLIRQLSDIGGQLAPKKDDLPPDDPGQDPFALQRATDAGMAAGLGRAAGYVFGGSGDIGSGGASALGAAGSIPSLHVENVTFTNSVQNQGQIARASNVGNDVLSGGRIRSSRARVSF